MEEIWKDIKGYEGLYQVSNLGRVKRMGRVNVYSNMRARVEHEKVLKLSNNKFGYKLVSLTKNKKENTFLIHRLVAIAFIENKNKYPNVNHLDNNPSNNFFYNLQWCTQKQNIQHAVVQNRMSSGKNHYMNKIESSKKPKCRLVLDLSTGIFYDSIKEAAIAKCLDIKKTQDHLHNFYKKVVKKNKTSLIYV